MNSKEHFDEIEEQAKYLVNRCIAFANEKETELSDRRLFRLYAAYVVAVDALTQGIKNSSAGFIEELNEMQTEKKDFRRDNL